MMSLLSQTIYYLLLSSLVYAGSITDDLDGWIMGADCQSIETGIRADGETGKYIRVPDGTAPFYYEVMDEGEGSVELWVKDNAACITDSNPGYPTMGPGWGLLTGGYARIMVHIYRKPEHNGCSGYSIWSSTVPYDALWFKDGIRGANGSSFDAGWYRWTISAGWDDISFTMHDVMYHAVDGLPYDDGIFGDCSQHYDRTSLDGAWESLFGDGFKAVCLSGENVGGCELIDVYVTAGSGVFSEVSDTPLPVGSGYQDAGWHELKQLFR